MISGLLISDNDCFVSDCLRADIVSEARARDDVYLRWRIGAELLRAENGSPGYLPGVGHKGVHEYLASWVERCPLCLLYGALSLEA